MFYKLYYGLESTKKYVVINTDNIKFLKVEGLAYYDNAWALYVAFIDGTEEGYLFPTEEDAHESLNLLIEKVNKNVHQRCCE